MVELADWTKAALSKLGGLAAGREVVWVLSLLSRFSLHKKVLLCVSFKIRYLIIFLRFFSPTSQCRQGVPNYTFMTIDFALCTHKSRET